MHWVRWAAIALFILGLALLGAAVAMGEATVYLVLVVPVVQATGPLAVGAIGAVFGGILLFFASTMGLGGGPIASGPASPLPAEVIPEEIPPASTRRAGGVIFLGPIPIVFGSGVQVPRWMIFLLATILFIFLLALWIAVALL